MYVALFLTPWMLMYTLSTVAMNHKNHEIAHQPAFTVEREFTYDGIFPESAKPRDIAAQLLTSLDMDGTHNIQRASAERITIVRQHPVAPRRITYTPPDRKVVIERMEFEASAYLERMHRRRGFQQPYLLEDTWAFSVDLVIAAICFWALSGLWMWWELRATRKLGALCLAIGAALFAFFVVMI